MKIELPVNRRTTSPARGAHTRLRVAFGPVTPGWGSWEWVGADLQRELAGRVDTASFGWNECPECDVAVIVKHLPPPEAIERLARRAAVVYAPVDNYGSEAEIAADAPSLRRCARIVVHCERLRPYFEPFAPVTYMDHHVKFLARRSLVGSPSSMVEHEATCARNEFQTTSPRFRDRPFILWAGVRSNLPPLVEWVNRYGLDLPLVVLTNLEQEKGTLTPALSQRERVDISVPALSQRERVDISVPALSQRERVDISVPALSQREREQFGFAREREVRVENWSARGQRELTAMATGAINIKGDDFRARHKPPAKAIDFVASGLPLAMNDSSGAEHLARIGFDVASPLDAPRWFSRAYREETVAFGAALREMLSLKMVGMRWSGLVEEVGMGRGGEEGRKWKVESGKLKV